MSYFQVILEGEYFFIDIDGEEELLGFFTTRWVKAMNPEEAELKAVNLLEKDQHLLSITRNFDVTEPSPKIYLSEICNVNWFTYIRHKPGGGYSFYPMASKQS